MEFQITDTKSLNKNTLKGVFALMVGPMKIEGWTYHVKGEKAWVNPPSKEYLDKDTGGKKYYPMIQFPEKGRYWDFQKWAVDLVKDKFDIQEPEPQQEANEVTDDDIPF